MYKVFVEKKDEEKELELAYLQQLDEDENKKYKVRVTDNNGRQYVRFATREKITELRQNPNIKSVEMTEHGEPYEGERRKGRMTAKAKAGKKLDPVGKESTEAKGKKDEEVSEKKKVDNYASGAVTMNPDQEKDEKKKKGANKSMQYAHLQLKGSTLSEAQRKMLEMYDEKKKKDEKKDKDKVSDMMTKTSVKWSKRSNGYGS